MILGFWVRIGYQPCARLNVSAVTHQNGCANRNRQVGITREREVPNNTAVDTASRGLEVVNDFESTRLGRARKRAGRERCAEHIHGVRMLGKLTLDTRDDVHDVTESFNFHELGDLDRARLTDAQEVIACEINQHQVLGALFGVEKQLISKGGVKLRCFATRTRASNGLGEHSARLNLNERFR